MLADRSIQKLNLPLLQVIWLVLAHPDGVGNEGVLVFESNIKVIEILSLETEVRQLRPSDFVIQIGGNSLLS